MKVQYNLEDNTMLIQLSKKKVDHAYETEIGLVHVDKNNEPVLLEMFDGKRFLEEQSKSLPLSVKHHFFASN